MFWGWENPELLGVKDGKQMLSVVTVFLGPFFIRMRYDLGCSHLLMTFLFLG